MVSQPTLFAPEPVALFHDDEGGIRYLPESIPAGVAQRWFDEALHNIGWLSRQRIMYDREVAVPRLLATFLRESADLPAPLGEAFEAVRALVGAPFNRVGLNLYRDGSDSVAPHSDKTDKLIPAQPIAIVSLGASRRMSIRPSRATLPSSSATASAKTRWMSIPMTRMAPPPPPCSW